MQTSAAGIALGILLACVGTGPADPVLRTAVLDGGGGRVAGGEIVLDASLGDGGGIASAGTATLKAGYAGQLYDLTGLSVTASPASVAEGATRQLTAAAGYDDGTVGPLDGTLLWSVVSGPLSGVSVSGLATAGPVWQATPATARATLGALRGTTTLTVLDTNPDNYGLYAADGLPDRWQVDAFGEENPDGVPAADPDEDDSPNSGEYAADTDPNDDTSYLRVTAVAAVGESAMRVTWQGGQLATQYLERTASLIAPDWRAVHTNPPPTLTAADWLDTAATAPACFYRLRAVR